MRAPQFWNEGGLLPDLLAPAAALYAFGAAVKQAAAKPQAAQVPVVCIGNAVAGGAGKTPVALSVAAALRHLGRAPAFLTRGYRGRLRGPVVIDPVRHNADDVGDEPLLLAAAGPTVLAVDRPAGAALACKAGADVVVMDDGLQNPSLKKDLALLVVDGGFGFGNGRVMPAGPLREPLMRAAERAHAAVLLGPDEAGARRQLPEGLAILEGRLAPAAGSGLVHKRVLAFAGIGRPEKFFRTLRDLPCDLVETVAFPDHHRFEPDEIMRLVEAAAAQKAVPVTTAKDHVRLPEEAKPMVRVLTVATEWRDPSALETLLERYVGAA